MTSSIEIGIGGLLGVGHPGVERAVISLPHWPHLITPMSHKTSTMRVFAYYVIIHLFQAWQTQMLSRNKKSPYFGSGGLWQNGEYMPLGSNSNFSKAILCKGSTFAE